MPPQQRSSYEPYTLKVHPTWGSYCSEHGYGHRVLCPGCGTTWAPATGKTGKEQA